MKNLKLISIIMVFLLGTAAGNTTYGGEKTKAFSSLSLSAGVSTYGIEFTLSAPLSNRFSISAAYNMAIPYTFEYTYDEFEPITKEFKGQTYTLNVPELNLNADMPTDGGMVKLNFTPKKNGGFYIAVGAYFGGDKLLYVGGGFPKSFMDELKEHEQYGFDESDVTLEIGDTKICPNSNGWAEAYIKTSTFKPYVGMGFGRNVPKRRVGFRAELGGIFVGTPSIESPNMSKSDSSEEADDITDLIGKLKVYPKISFHLSFLLFRPKNK